MHQNLVACMFVSIEPEREKTSSKQKKYKKSACVIPCKLSFCLCDSYYTVQRSRLIVDVLIRRRRRCRNDEALESLRRIILLFFLVKKQINLVQIDEISLCVCYSFQFWTSGRI